MLSDKYRDCFLEKTKKFDEKIKDNYQLFEIAKDLTKNDKDEIILEFLRQVIVLVKKNNQSDIFEIRDGLIESLYLYLGAKRTEKILINYKNTSNLSFEELMKNLDELVGLENVKEQVQNLIIFNKIQQCRVHEGLEKSDKTMHMAFMGNPGTAKTTVARIVGKMYKSMRILSNGQFIEVSRTDLIAEYQGQTAIKVKKLIERAKGGVLFIDEAYSITENKQSDSYGRECLTELTKALEDYRDDLVVIVAGYTDLMEDFFDSNPGLKSRFNTFVNFDDYSLKQLVEIFEYLCMKNEYILEDGCTTILKDIISFELEKKDRYFSNGRYIRNLFDDIIVIQSKRLFKNVNKLKKEDLMLIKKEDISSKKIKIMELVK